MQVPVKIIVDTDTKEFEITVGTPPASSLIKNFITSSKAILVARSIGKAKAPVLIAGKAIVFTLFLTAIVNELT